MKKATRIMLAAGLALAVATPALADLKVSGNYRLMGYSNELKDTDYKKGDSQQWIDQRLRLGVTNTLNDNVSITYLAEIDNVWGSSGTSALGNGGAFDGDGVNVETKHAYLDLKSGDTSARLGLQGYADQFEGLIVNGDMAGALVKHKLGDTSIALLYSKWDENDGDGGDVSATATPAFSDWDDTDFYGVSVSQKVSDAFTVGAGVYYLDINDSATGEVRTNIVSGLSGLRAGAVADRTDAEIFYYGLTAAAKFGDFTVDGFGLYQDGTVTVAGGNDQTSDTWAWSLKGTMKLANGNIGLRGIYITDDDAEGDNEQWMGAFGQYDFVNENQMIFLTDKFTQNATKERYAMQDAATQGFGLMALVLSGNHTLPENMYLNWGLGYYSAVEDQATQNGGNSERDGKTLGYEVCARLGKKVFEKVDISLNAAFADFGSFYDESTQKDNAGLANKDPDSIYKTYLMVNVPF